MNKKKGTKNVPAVKKKKAIVKASAGVRAISSVDPQALLAQAIDKNLPIESMERLLAMRREMKAEWARDQFFASLAGFQRECPAVEKSKKVMDKDKVTKADKGVRYAYAPLEDIVEVARPFMEKWGFSWTIKPRQTKEDVTASCIAHHRDGHEEVTEFTVPLDPSLYMSDPQKAAAALTFARRYAFINAFGIVTKGEDTDAAPSDSEDKRTPIRTPQAAKPEPAIPTTHEAVIVPGSHEEFAALMGATEMAPGVGRVAIFTETEVIDWRTNANQAKNDKEELAKVFADVRTIVDSRRKAIRGDKA